MNERDSQPTSSGKPKLAKAYEDANLKVYRAILLVRPEHYAKFSVREDDLVEWGIDSMLYAKTVCAMLREWAHMHKLKWIPQNTFLGNWAYERFLKVLNTTSVDLQLDDDTMLYSELMVARVYLTEHLRGNPVRFRDVVRDLGKALDPGWLYAYHLGDRRVQDDALYQLSLEFGCKATTYAEMASKLVNRGRIPVR